MTAMAAKKKTGAKTMAQRIEAVHEARVRTRAGGGEKRIAKQHEQGKMTARERLDALLDEGTFQEIGLFRKNRAEPSGWTRPTCPPTVW